MLTTIARYREAVANGCQTAKNRLAEVTLITVPLTILVNSGKKC